MHGHPEAHVLALVSRLSASSSSAVLSYFLRLCLSMHCRMPLRANQSTGPKVKKTAMRTKERYEAAMAKTMFMAEMMPAGRQKAMRP